MCLSGQFFSQEKALPRWRETAPLPRTNTPMAWPPPRRRPTPWPALPRPQWRHRHPGHRGCCRRRARRRRDVSRQRGSARHCRGWRMGGGPRAWHVMCILAKCLCMMGVRAPITREQNHIRTVSVFFQHKASFSVSVKYACAPSGGACLKWGSGDAYMCAYVHICIRAMCAAYRHMHIYSES